MQAAIEVGSIEATATVTHEHGWIESDGRILLAGKVVEVAGVVKNAAASAPEPLRGDPFEEANYEVILTGERGVSITGDVDAQLEVIFRHLVQRLDRVELAGPLERLRSSVVGGIKHMPIRYRLRS